MDIKTATSADSWDAFLASQPYSPFLQSWTMGEVYGDIGQEPIRLEALDDGKIVGICFAHVVPARRGKHLSVPYGPVVGERKVDVARALLAALKQEATKHGCSFIRMSPFWHKDDQGTLENLGAMSSPLHLLGEHLWLLPLKDKTEDQLLMAMRKTTRNLIGRAGRDGVTIEASTDPNKDIEHFLRLHDETRKRHQFTPYTNTFFRSELKRFAAKGQATLYMARYQNQVIATSMHIHAFGETSYHHGASSSEFHKIPASYLLQWRAIQDALKRGDRLYNFWGIAPIQPEGDLAEQLKTVKGHPFAGVTLFKTGFGGHLLPLVHCSDIPLKSSYYMTKAFELLRKWRRGF